MNTFGAWCPPLILNCSVLQYNRDEFLFHAQNHLCLFVLNAWRWMIFIAIETFFPHVKILALNCEKKLKMGSPVEWLECTFCLFDFDKRTQKIHFHFEWFGINFRCTWERCYWCAVARSLLFVYHHTIFICLSSFYFWHRSFALHSSKCIALFMLCDRRYICRLLCECQQTDPTNQNIDENNQIKLYVLKRA